MLLYLCILLFCCFFFAGRKLLYNYLRAYKRWLCMPFVHNFIHWRCFHFSALFTLVKHFLIHCDNKLLVLALLRSNFYSALLAAYPACSRMCAVWIVSVRVVFCFFLVPVCFSIGIFTIPTTQATTVLCTMPSTNSFG